MKLSIKLLTIAILAPLVGAQAIAADIDVNMQYTHDTNALGAPNSQSSLELESVERIITGSGVFTETANSATDWNITLHEKLAKDLKYLSFADLSGSLGYHWQSKLGFREPWKSTGIEFSVRGAQLSEHSELRSSVFYNVSRFVTDNLLLTSQVDYEYAWRSDSQINGGLLTMTHLADYSVNDNVSIYSKLSMSAGQHLLTYDLNSDASFIEKISSSSKIERLSSEFENDWYTGIIDAGQISALIGFSSGVDDLIALDFTYEVSNTQNSDFNYLESTAQISLFLAY